MAKSTPSLHKNLFYIDRDVKIYLSRVVCGWMYWKHAARGLTDAKRKFNITINEIGLNTCRLYWIYLAQNPHHQSILFLKICVFQEFMEMLKDLSIYFWSIVENNYLNFKYILGAFYLLDICNYNISNPL